MSSTGGKGRADVLVIGAGMAGVAAARALAQGGLRVVLLEARDRIGGRLHTLRDLGGPPVEAGAEFIHGKGAATWTDVHQAGLRTAAVPYSGSWFRLGGRLAWLPLHLAHPGVWRSFDILWSLGRLRGPDTSAARFIESKGYKGRARELAALTLTAHLPGSVEEVGVRGLASDGVLHLESGVNHRVLDGYDTLAAHIATGLRVAHEWVVEGVEWSTEGVSVRADDGRKFSADAAISTLPHGVLSARRVRFEPELPPARRAAIDSIATGAVAKVILGFDERFWPARMTQLVCGTGPVTLYWPVSYGGDDPDSHPVLSAYATGPRALALSEAGPEVAVEMVLEDLAGLYPGVPVRGMLHQARVVDWLADPFACGGYTFLPPGAVGARARLAAPDTGRLFWAGSATQWHPVADTVEAAFLSGLRAARQVSSVLAREEHPGRPG